LRINEQETRLILQEHDDDDDDDIYLERTEKKISNSIQAINP